MCWFERMWVKFTDADTFCSFFPAADDATMEQSAEAVGKENLYRCTLEKSSTPFTDVYFYQDTIFPGGGDNGKLTMLLPGSVAYTNGALVEENGVAWTWTKDGVAVPMYLYTVGLVDFKLSLNVSINTNGTSNLIIITTAPKNVLAYAPSMYSSSNSAQALATRIANGLNLSDYQISSKDVGSQVKISIVISNLSQQQLQATLNQSGLISQVIVKGNSSFLNGHYEFSGNLSPWKSHIGYPDSITLNVTMPGQSSSQFWIANGNTQPISTISEFTNWCCLYSTFTEQTKTRSLTGILAAPVMANSPRKRMSSEALPSINSI